MNSADAPSTQRWPLHWRILTGLIVGVLAGLLARSVFSTISPDAKAWVDWFATNIAESVGKVFLRLIFMVVIPLVFSSLVLGVAGIGDPRRLGRIGAWTFGITLLLSLASVLIGLGVVNAIRPGDSLRPEQRAALQEQFSTGAEATVANARKSKSLRDSLLDMIPNNPLQEMVGALDGSSPGNGILSVMFFALVVGLAITVLPTESQPLVALLESIFQISMKVIGWAMELAPWGVAGLMFSMTNRLGSDILWTLAWYVATVFLGLGLQWLIAYSIALSTLGGISPLKFARRISTAALTAFSTSSSNATLPTALRVAEEQLQLRPETARFVLTVGSTANQNGTALYEGVTVLFLAQVFGVELSLIQQMTVLILCVFAGIGTAGVPGGSLPATVLVLQTIGVNAGGIAIILGVDRLLDMARTTLNVVGDLVVAQCVDRMEGGMGQETALPAGQPSAGGPDSQGVNRQL